MPPNSTQNLNARLTGLNGPHGSIGAGINLKKAPIQSSVPPVRIVGASVPYRGGYHLSF